MNEITLIFLVAFLFIFVYFIGMYRNRKIGVGYARTIKDYMKNACDFVGFQPYYRGGFRVLCKPKETFTRIEMAVSLVDRENLMHYPLSLITKDCDLFACWGFLRGSLSFDLDIIDKRHEKAFKKTVSNRGLREVKIDKHEISKAYKVFSSDEASAIKLLDYELAEAMGRLAGNIKRISISREEPRIYILGKVRSKESLIGYMDLLMNLGRRIRGA